MTTIKISAATLCADPGCSLNLVRAQAPAPPPSSRRQLGALAPANLAKPRPKPPFDLTGVWLHGGGPNNRVPILAARPGSSSRRSAGALRRGAEGAEGRQGLSRRHRPVLAGGTARDHDARLADRDDAVPNRHLHGQRVHEQPAGRLHGWPPALRSRRRRAQLQWRVDRTMGGGHAGDRHAVFRRPPSLDRFRHSRQHALHIVERDKHDQQRADAGDRVHAERSEELGRRMEDDQAVESRRTIATSPKSRACPISTITCRARARRTTFAEWRTR